MNTSVIFSSAKCEWETPKHVFDQLHQEFGFELDVCALPENAKCDRYFTPEQDGLGLPWTGVCWMNPPYGRAISKWVRNAQRHASDGLATVVCLLPARTDTAWWQDVIIPFSSEIRFIRGRLKFGGAKNGAPFPSAVVIFKKSEAA